jgi:hypothetical protein
VASTISGRAQGSDRDSRHRTIAGQIGRAEPDEGERPKEQSHGHMAEGYPPPQHAGTAEQVQHDPERQWAEEAASVPERRVDGQCGAALPALPAVSDDESDQISVA